MPCRPAAARPGKPALMTPRPAPCSGRSAIPIPIPIRPSAAAPISTPTRWWRWMPRAGISNGRTSSRLTTPMTGTRPEPMVLADTIWKGRPRKLLMSAQRSGVFYVLDRTNGEFLLAKPFVKKFTWADGFDPKTGEAHLVPGNTPTEEGTKTCPGVRGATNWYPPSFNPQTPAVLCDGGGRLRHLSQQGPHLRQQSRPVRSRPAPGARAQHRDRRRGVGKGRCPVPRKPTIPAS